MEHFEHEEHLRDWIQAELQRRLQRAGTAYVVLSSKNVNDVIVCREDADMPLAFFIEVKYAKSSSGRIGIGDGRGCGFQPEILIRKPFYFERFTRWLVASEVGVAVLVDGDTLRRHAVGGVFSMGKQNNIRYTVFDVASRPFSLGEAPDRIVEWLESARPNMALHPTAAV